MTAAHQPGAKASTASRTMADRSKVRKMAAGHRSSAGIEMTKNSAATTSPTASPSSARSTTTVASAVQKRWPRRETTYTRTISPARSGKRLFPM